jgi:hypothetical protein
MNGGNGGHTGHGLHMGTWLGSIWHPARAMKYASGSHANPAMRVSILTVLAGTSVALGMKVDGSGAVPCSQALPTRHAPMIAA